MFGMTFSLINRSLGRVTIGKPRAALRFLLLLLISTLWLAACSRTVDDPSNPLPDPNIPTPDPVAPEWRSEDIGQVGVAGSAQLLEDSLAIVLGSGEDIWGYADSFHFFYRTLEGDGGITARVTSIDETHPWAKAGVMIREELTDNARHALVALTPRGIVEFNRRQRVGGLTSNDQRQTGSSTRWVRLVRQGNTFYSYESGDGVNWQLLASDTISMSDRVYIGLAVTSRNNDRLAEGRLDNVTIDFYPPIDPNPDDPSDPPPGPDPNLVIHVTYAEDRSEFTNPERGFYGTINLVTGRDFSNVTSQGLSLAHSLIRLDNYRYQPLPEDFLMNLRQGLEAARGAGIKVIPRFSYNFGFYEDAPLDWVLQHIAQLAPILQEYQDVIAVLQAGFIGAWGEWHSSTNNLTTPANRETIAGALLQALPPSRMIQIRYPYYIRDLYPIALTAEQAFRDTDYARTGHHNDCLLSTGSDGGTYITEHDRAYTERVSLYTAMGGETCDLGGLYERNDCTTALAELNRYNWDYLNHDFWRPIIDKWRAQGCYDEIRRRLGYRLRLIEATISQQTSPGGSLTLTMHITNDGFGKVYNPRPIELILRHTETRSEHIIQLTDDARAQLPLSGETRILTFNIRLPNGIATGAYDVFLRLPDPAPSLSRRPQYSIRFANVGTWEASTGYNALRMTIDVNP